jgi:hypothetical protein
VIHRHLDTCEFGIIMKFTMGKIFLYIAVFASLLLAAGCGKDSEETAPADSAGRQYTVTYKAGENGTIEGDSDQTVAHGSDGSLVTAVPHEHYHFTGWSDGVTAASRTDFNVRTNLLLTANFAIDQYALTYSAGENGSVEGTTFQIVDHGGNSSPVTAVPADGYHFVSWNDGIDTAKRVDYDVKTNLAVGASFAPNQYTLQYTPGKNGSIEGFKTQIVAHGSDGSAVTAIPAEGYHFTGWSDGIDSAKRTDLDVEAHLSVTANFAINQYTRSYTAGEDGAIEGATSQKIDHGGSGTTITAVPAEGYHFTGWSDGVTTASRTDSGVTGNVKVTAEFGINKYTLTYTAGENGSIEGTSQQTVEHGSEGSLVAAVADKGHHFTTWSDGITDAQRLDKNITGELTVSALFEINTYTLGGVVSGLAEGNELVLQNNGGDDLVITANGDFKFANELLRKTVYEVSVLTQPASPNQTCTVTSGTGTISDENVNDISVACVLNTYIIGGTVSDLPDGVQVILQNNGGDDLVVNSNGIFTFATPLDDGSVYEVKVSSAPTKENWTCDIKNGAAYLAGQDVTDIIVECFPEVVLQALTGIRKIKLNWNAHDFPDQVAFNLCLAQDDISPGGFDSCRELKGGALIAKVKHPLTASKLTNDTPYWSQLEAHYESGRRTFSKVVKAIPYGSLNDSGIDWCADNIINYNSDATLPERANGCKALAASHPGQDAVHGRDALARDNKLTKIGNGSAGFDFTKLCMSGDYAGEGECPSNPFPGIERNSWACIRDNVTGLTWEIKMDRGLRSRDNTYTWYNQDATVNGGKPGLENGGKCEDSGCDTFAYIQAINDLGLCGATDWRLPTKSELLSIVDNSRIKPALDDGFFPNTLPLHYWTSSPYPKEEDSAWQVYFLYGEAFPMIKSESNHIRLVRGRTVTFGRDNP